MQFCTFLPDIVKATTNIGNLMIQNKNQNILFTGMQIIYIVMQCQISSTSGFKWIDPKNFDLKKYNKNSSKGSFLEVTTEYLQELRELHDDYHLAPDKIEIKEAMLFKYQLMIDDFLKFLLVISKKLVPKFFNKEKFLLNYGKLQPYLRLGLKD